MLLFKRKGESMSQHHPIIVNDFVEIDFEWALKQQCNYKECAKACTKQYQRGLPSNLTPAEFLYKLKKIYNKNKPSAQNKKSPIINITQAKIPFIIHQIWFGGKLPEIYKIWQKRLKKLHTKWEIINWTDSKLKREFPRGLINQKTFDQAKNIHNYAQMADVARYEILHKFGGLYLDYDTKCFKSFETLHTLYTFYAGLDNFKTSCYCSNTIIGSQPQHSIIGHCIKMIKDYENTEPDLSQWQYEEEFSKEACKRTICTGPKIFTQAIIDVIDQEGYTDIIFPQEYFYPEKQTNIAFCYHASHSSWKDRIKDHFEEKEKTINRSHLATFYAQAV